MEETFRTNSRMDHRSRPGRDQKKRKRTRIRGPSAGRILRKPVYPTVRAKLKHQKANRMREYRQEQTSRTKEGAPTSDSAHQEEKIRTHRKDQSKNPLREDRKDQSNIFSVSSLRSKKQTQIHNTKKYRITRLRGSDECSERAASIPRQTDVQVGLAYSTSIHEWKRRFERTPVWITAPQTTWP